MKTATTFLESWVSVSDTVVELKCQNVLSRTFEQSVEAIDVESVGFEIRLGTGELASLAWVPCNELISVIGCIIGTGPIENTGQRKLTFIEVSLCELIFETLASSLSTAWPGVEPLPIHVGGLDDMPQRSRLIRPKDLVLVTQIEIMVADSNTHITWLLPRQEVEVLMDAISGTAVVKQHNSPLATIKQLGLELVGVLGRAQLTMGELEKLQIGDLVILEQKIDQPIAVNIEDETHFYCWPGRLGKRQGLEIAEVL